MSRDREIDVQYVLRTFGGGKGRGWVGSGFFQWDVGSDPNGVVGGASFRIAVGHDMGIDCEIDGDDWRTLEDNGNLDDILEFAQKGYTIEEAVQAALDQEDPDAGEPDLMDQLSAAQERAQRLESLLERTSLFVAKHNLLLAREIDRVLKEGM